MIRSIPPITSTGPSRAKRGVERTKLGIPSGIIKIGTGGIRRAAPKREEEFKPIHSWAFTSKPKFARYSPTEKDKYVLIEKIKEPAIRVLKDITETVVVANLPGVEEKDIHIELHGDILEISAQAKDEFGLQKYAKEMLLPFMVDPKTIRSSFENNILEINLQAKTKGRRR